MLFHLRPGPSAAPSVLEIVISQFAWCAVSGPQAGEKRAAVAVTPVTWCTHEPAASIKQPPVLICGTMFDPLVSLTHSLIDRSDTLSGVVPVLETLKKSWAWLAPHELVSSCKLTLA